MLHQPFVNTSALKLRPIVRLYYQRSSFVPLCSIPESNCSCFALKRPRTANNRLRDIWPEAVWFDMVAIWYSIWLFLTKFVWLRDAEISAAASATFLAYFGCRTSTFSQVADVPDLDFQFQIIRSSMSFYGNSKTDWSDRFATTNVGAHVHVHWGTYAVKLRPDHYNPWPSYLADRCCNGLRLFWSFTLLKYE